MVIDIVFFVIIAFIFICLFGVISQASLYPGNDLNLWMFKNIVDAAYWPVFGEIQILEQLDFDSCVRNAEDCQNPEKSGVIFVYIVLLFYVIIANVLLVNLLIAMFRFVEVFVVLFKLPL